MNPMLGMLVFALGGLAGATFLLPARGVKNWAHETWRMLYCVVGLLVMPAAICAVAVPDFWTVAMSAPASTILFSTAIGVFGGEWKGTGTKTRRSLALGTVTLLASFTVISLGSR
jgi:L-rhamnose-H+ transport protein